MLQANVFEALREIKGYLLRDIREFSEIKTDRALMYELLLLGYIKIKNGLVSLGIREY